MMMRTSRSRNWLGILALGILLEGLLSASAHAEIFRRPLFGRRFNSRQSNFTFNRGVSSNRNFGSNQSFFNRNSRFNQNPNIQNVKEVLGFSQLLQAGNTIIEKTSEGIIRRLQIRGNGELLAFDPRAGRFVRPEAETVRHLRQFYLGNLDKFRGNAKNVVNRFLAANGGISNGRLVVDLDSINIAGMNMDNLPLAERRKAALASLNFLLNSLQTNFKIRIPPEKVINGKVELNLAPFFSQKALAIIAQADDGFQCTGQIRLNNLIAFTMDPKNYNEIIDAPEDASELALRKGIQLDKTRTLGNKIAILNHESGVSPGEQRIVEVQTTENTIVNNQVKGSCYRSLDAQDRPQSGIEARSRSVRLKGINFQHEAEEWLCLGRNGFMESYLYNNPDGKRLTEAPASIAHQSGANGPAIRAGASCLDCHSDGFIAGGISKASNKPYTNFFEKPDTFPTSPTIFRDSLGNPIQHRDFFTSNDRYKERAEVDSNIFINAQKETGSFYRIPPELELNAGETNKATAVGKNPGGGPRPGRGGYALIPKVKEAYDATVDAKTAARELGISPEAAERLVTKDGMSRVVFDARYCNLRQGINADLNEFQTRDLLQRESRQPFRDSFDNSLLHNNGGASFNPNFFNGLQNSSQFIR